MAGEAVLSRVLQELLSKLSSPILDEFGLLWGVKKEKQKLQSNLSRIKAVLQDAERQQIDLMADKDRLGKLKDVAYDAEDLVDEFLVEALRRKVENQDGMGRTVDNFFSPANPLAFRFKIAHKMKELRERFEELAEENNNFQSAEGVARIQPQIPNPRDTASSVPVWGVYGRDYQKENYIDSLINSGNEEVLSVIPIVGMGGLGKTTLAQYVYDDERVVTHFNLKMWVYVSEDFDVGRILARILQSATNKSTPTDGSSMDLLNTRVKENLSGKRYLLVLDDVWNEDSEKWDRLRTAVQCGAKGSKVLVTTRSDTVARRMDALPRPPLATLSPVESWTLFEKVAHPPTGFVSIGKEIVRKCGGVPLAIKTLGGMLRNETSEREWQSVRDSELWKQTDNEGGILSIIRLSYDHLTSSLKQCFAYCAVIPKGHSFYKDVLIKQWIAQGFIHSDDENELLEEEGEKYFSALLRRSLFQADVKTAGNDTYEMHDLIHDLLKSVTEKECLVVEASMMNDLTRLLALCNDETRHLALCNDEWAGDPKNLDALKKCKKLRSMITYGYYRRIDINVCLSFRCLRVLDLCSRRSIHFLPNSIDKLRHLRYFDISYTLITELPETICNLHNLQTLRVFGIPLKKWPKNMKRMISLRHIEFSRDRGGDFLLPKGIGELTCLRTLSKFVINEESEPGMEELKDLNQLMGDISIAGLENIRNGACAREADLKAKKHLHSLRLHWNRSSYESEGNAQEVINNLEPPSNLKKLLVWNYIGLSFPSWMMMLSNLIHIELRGCIRCEQLPPFGQLPLLESLEIYEMSAIKYIVKFDGSHNNKDIFRSLRRLVLKGLSNLERWSSPQENGDGDEQRREEDEQVILGRLSRLDIDDCPNLVRLPKLLFPALEFLKMNGVGCDRIDLPMSKSLKGVSLTDMPNLEMWSSREADDDQKVIYPLLKLDVRNCPKMVRLPHLLPSLKELIIVKTDEMLLGSLANYTSLVRLDIEGFPEVMHLPEEIGPTHANNLHTLEIYDCPKLISISHQLKYLHSLEELRICQCPELVLPSLDGSQEQQPCPPLNSLKKLEIWESCEKQRLLRGEGMIMTSLEELEITKCGNLESLFFEGLQNLTSLDIEECPKVWSSPEWLRNLTSLKKLRGVVLDAMTSLTNPLENLKSLKDLSISSGPDMTDFPEWIGNLASLTALWFADCPSIRSLPESLGNLASLTDLEIEGCPGIRSLPESFGNLLSLSNMDIAFCPALTELPKGLQRLTNLRELRILECPDLKRRLCKNWKEWKKVAHVPKISIDYRSYSWEAEHPSLMQSLKKGCNEFNKKLHFPTCASSSSP
ncbi:putative disease resistance protein RGA4 [Cinnamomum micranthum f. kanehirae]|uniref:Putative disease resistance protein RGA4 n=1 Tax=Cinnamomum micranthum f. kanehirae TaxID=337451 RepID=A0A3S3QYL4_9MAGN|nr:putative disease resistance protein RGA4 [Cinnamomum micranthum f. kanehirae]